jgi:hypothetical protein
MGKFNIEIEMKIYCDGVQGVSRPSRTTSSRLREWSAQEQSPLSGESPAVMHPPPVK